MTRAGEIIAGVLACASVAVAARAGGQATTAGLGGDVLCGELIDAALDPDDIPFGDGTWYDDWYLVVDEPTRLRVSMDADGFEPYLLVYDGDDFLAAEGFSPLYVALNPGEEYLIAANNFDVLEPGSYEYVLDVQCAPTPADVLVCGEPVDGVLGPGDRGLGDRVRFDEYRLTLDAERRVVIDMAAYELTPFIFVEQGDEVVDLGNPPLALTLPAGEYRIQATHVEDADDGYHAYRLNASCSAAETLACGRTVQGALTADDVPLDDGTYAEPFALSLAAVTELTLDVAADFDSYVLVFDDEDEIVEGGLSPFTVALTAGEYLVYVNNFEPLPGVLHPFALSLTCAGNCPGDCDENGAVEIFELVRGVGIVLGLTPLTECFALDLDADGSVAVNDLVRAVNAALNGCAL